MIFLIWKLEKGNDKMVTEVQNNIPPIDLSSAQWTM